MALSGEDLKAISGLLQPLKDDLKEIKTEQQTMKAEQREVKGSLKDTKDGLESIRRRLSDVELHFENVTDKSIQLLAENFIELVKKLNQAIPAADSNRAYEVKVNYLIEKVQVLEKEVAELKRKTA